MAIHHPAIVWKIDHFLLWNAILPLSEVANQMILTTHRIEHPCTMQQKSFRVMSLEKMQEESMRVVMSVAGEQTDIIVS
jgi:hypothetical protein